jgi:hypothetical protein
MRSLSPGPFILLALLASTAAFSQQVTGADSLHHASIAGEAASIPDTLSSAAGSSDIPSALQPPKPDPVDTLSAEASSLRLGSDEYRFAGGPRYTITGEPPFRKTHLRPLPLGVTVGSLAAIVTAIHLYQQDAWWANQRGAFHFETAWDYAAEADKFGHMCSGYFSSYVAHEALVASGVGSDLASWLGPTIGLAFMTYIEVEDGFAAGWGFDPTDQYANTAGAALFAAQQYLPWLQNVTMKWSYWPTDKLDAGTPGHRTIVVDDYNGTMVWFSLKLSNVLPESIGWPKWLRLAGGYGAYNVDQLDAQGHYLTPDRKVFIALDYDLVELLPNMGSFGNWLVQTANFIHLPAPALQILPSVKFQLLYPIPL